MFVNSDTSCNRWSFSCLLSLGIIFSRMIHIVAYISASFFFIAKYCPFYGYNTFYLSVQLMSIVLFPLFAYFEKRCYKYSRTSFLYRHKFLFLLSINLAVELLGHCELYVYYFKKKVMNWFLCNCTILHSHQQYMNYIGRLNIVNISIIPNLI